MPRTYKEKLCIGLEALGFKRDLSDRSKYAAFTKGTATVAIQGKIFVGTSGALRTGRCASDSISVGDPTRMTPFYKLVLEKAGPEPNDHKAVMAEYLKDL